MTMTMTMTMTMMTSMAMTHNDDDADDDVNDDDDDDDDDDVCDYNRRVGGIEDVKRQMLEMNLMLKEFYFTWGSKFARIE